MEVGTKSSVRFSTFSVDVKKTWSWFFPRNPPRSTNCPCAMQLCPSWRACNGTGDPDTNSESSFIIHFFRGAAMGLFESFWWRPFSTCSLHFSKYSPPKIDKHVHSRKKKQSVKKSKRITSHSFFSAKLLPSLLKNTRLRPQLVTHYHQLMTRCRRVGTVVGCSHGTSISKPDSFHRHLTYFKKHTTKVGPSVNWPKWWKSREIRNSTAKNYSKCCIVQPFNTPVSKFGVTNIDSIWLAAPPDFIRDTPGISFSTNRLASTRGR